MILLHHENTLLLYMYLFHLLHASTTVIHVVLELGRAGRLKVILKFTQECIIELRQLPKHCRHGGLLQHSGIHGCLCVCVCVSE